MIPEGTYPATVLRKVSSDPTDPRYNAAINIETDHTFTGEQFTDGNYTIYFLVKKNTGETDADKTDFTVDKKAPTVELNYPKPDDPQAGEITVSGSIIDEGAGVKETMTKYILGKKASTPTVSTPDYNAATAPHGWKAMDKGIVEYPRQLG